MTVLAKKLFSCSWLEISYAGSRSPRHFGLRLTLAWTRQESLGGSHSIPRLLLVRAVELKEGADSKMGGPGCPPKTQGFNTNPPFFMFSEIVCVRDWSRGLVFAEAQMSSVYEYLIMS